MEAVAREDDGAARRGGAPRKTMTGATAAASDRNGETSGENEERRRAEKTSRLEEAERVDQRGADEDGDAKWLRRQRGGQDESQGVYRLDFDPI